jgi:hypothetical protein
MSDNDGIDDALRNAAQLAAGMLARLGEAQSRATQQHAIDQEHAVTAASTRAEHQISQAAAQEQAAMARLRLVHDPNWWAAATIRQVSDTWQIADAYRDRQDADAAREVMTREITSHWRVTLETDADSAAVRRLLEQAEHDRQQERGEDQRAEHDRERARTIEDETNREGQHAQHVNDAAQPPSDMVAGTDEAFAIDQARARADSPDQQIDNQYDSAGQRQARAEGYAKSGDQRATQARLLADKGNALPPVYATRVEPGRRHRPLRGPHQPHSYYRILSDRSR